MARVFTNVPGSPHENLSMEGMVRVSIHVSNTSIFLRGLPRQTVSRTITIRTEMARPLALEQSHFDLQEKVRYRIREIEAGKVFQVCFTNIPGPVEEYFGQLKLRTNYPERPEIAFQIRGRFRNE
ncbi:MAG: hypothetical protein JW821_18710 [Deltaproteobacteria bacterium]|nr:hypothetical protein [Deltaproteobacteria bacterium]